MRKATRESKGLQFCTLIARAVQERVKNVRLIKRQTVLFIVVRFAAIDIMRIVT